MIRELKKNGVLNAAKQIEEYLSRENVKHGEIGEWPAWHVTPDSMWSDAV